MTWGIKTFFQKNPLVSWQFGSRLYSFMSATVIGYPRWLAKYTENAICRIKWLCAAAIIVWVITGYAMTSTPLNDFSEAVHYLNISSDLFFGTNVLIWTTLVVGILGCIFFLFFSPRQLYLNGSKWLVAFVVLTSLTAEGLHLGLSHIHYRHVISFDLALLLTFVLAPLSIPWLVTLFFISLAVVLGSAVITGHILVRQDIAFMTNPLSYAALGIVVNRWHYRKFKSEWLTSIRLHRRTEQLERQKVLIEQQKNEAQEQRAEIALQRGQLLKVLASALTGPVSQAYNEKGFFNSEIKTVCVIACDAVGFSETCHKLQPDRVISELENFFCEFDSACLRYTVEPLRAQGDSRIAIAGLWQTEGQELHHAVISAILAMLTFKKVLPNADEKSVSENRCVLWPARIGMSLGQVACGIIDTSKGFLNRRTSINHPHINDTTINGRLWFDVWGDTVNVAARLQQGAEVNQILVRESVLWETRGLFDYGPIHELKVKSTIVPDVAEIIGIRKQFCNDSGEPNEAFEDVINARDLRPYKPKREGTVSEIKK